MNLCETVHAITNGSMLDMWHSFRPFKGTISRGPTVYQDISYQQEGPWSDQPASSSTRIEEAVGLMDSFLCGEQAWLSAGFSMPFDWLTSIHVMDASPCIPGYHLHTTHQVCLPEDESLSSPAKVFVKMYCGRRIASHLTLIICFNPYLLVFNRS